MELKAKLDSASERTSQYDAIQLNPRGTATLNVCPYNVRTLRTEDNLDRLTDEFEQIKWDIIGLCETCRKGEGL